MRPAEADGDDAIESDGSQVRFWNGLAGKMWVLTDEENERHTGPFGDAAILKASPQFGERVLDVGCGCGSTSLALAYSVGDGGKVMGVDLSGIMLEKARQRAKEAKIANLEFLQSDAQKPDVLRAELDLVFSRFGMMFFSEPETAFANLRSALRPSGRMVFVCWQVPKVNPWMALPNRAALEFFGLSAPPHDAPGPFSLANPDRVHAILGIAGFSKVEITEVTRTLRFAVGKSIDGWVHERLLMGLAGEMYESASPTIQSQARRFVAATVEPYEVDNGLEMSGAAWVVSAIS